MMSNDDGYMFHQHKPVNFKNNTLLNTGASFTSTNNPNLVDNKIKATVPMSMKTNTGTKQIMHIVELPGMKKKV